jgi:hypothetical protein
MSYKSSQKPTRREPRPATDAATAQAAAIEEQRRALQMSLDTRQ